MGRPDPTRPAVELRVAVAVKRPEEREELCRRLAGPALGLRAVPGASLAEALLPAEARRADLVLGDLAALEELVAFGGEEALGIPFCLLLAPGSEERSAPRLEATGVDFVLQAGDYHLLLPGRLRRLLRAQASPAAELARLIRHDINNPLTGILGNAELILSEGASLPERTQQRLATIIQLAVRLRDVLREIEEPLRGAHARPSQRLPSRRAPAPPLARHALR